MKFVIFDVPESGEVPVEVGDVLTLEQSAQVSEINPEEHRRRSLIAAKFWDEKGIGYEVIRERGDPALPDSTDTRNGSSISLLS
jgi:hypothetical protein